MPDVTRFPHYHQAENVVTNHVMVMLMTLYRASPKLLEALLQAICPGKIEIGPRFTQQISGTHSVPDGLILQRPVAIFVETKLGETADPDQLQQHCRTIERRLNGQEGGILISLTSGLGGQSVPKAVIDVATKHRVAVVSITFGELVTNIKQLDRVDLTLDEIINEFEEFIIAQGLFPRTEQLVVAVLTGTSWRENVAHRVYYEPATRNPKWRQAAFLGLYHDKQVSHVGRIIAAVSAMQGDSNDIVFDEPEFGTLNENHRRAIRAAIRAAIPYYPDLVDSRHRYYLVDGFSETDFQKKTRGGMMGHRYFDIEEISDAPLPADASGSQAAEALSGKTFE